MKDKSRYDPLRGIQPAGNSGFTLFELLIVLIIIGITSAIVFISLDVAHKKTILRDTARRAYLQIRHAREVSVLEQTVVTVTVGEEGTGYSISTGQPPEKTEDRASPAKGRSRRILYSVRLPEGISIEGDDLIFYPRGESSGGSLVIRDNEGRSFIIVVESLSGKAKLIKEG